MTNQTNTPTDITLRDYFAAQAMSGLIAAQAGTYSANCRLIASASDAGRRC